MMNIFPYKYEEKGLVCHKIFQMYLTNFNPHIPVDIQPITLKIINLKRGKDGASVDTSGHACDNLGSSCAVSPVLLHFSGQYQKP